MCFEPVHEEGVSREEEQRDDWKRQRSDNKEGCDVDHDRRSTIIEWGDERFTIVLRETVDRKTPRDVWFGFQRGLFCRIHDYY
jgi:hypothetical protein